MNPSLPLLFSLPNTIFFLGLSLGSLSGTLLLLPNSSGHYTYTFSGSSNFFETLFIIAVILISAHASILANFYITGEPHYSGFLLVTLAFILSMLTFIASDSPLTLLLGWDGLGATSFFLVIWYQSWNSVDSGIITFLSNRLGDFFLIFSLCSFLHLGWVAANLSFSFMFSLLILVACLTNSAQIPFSAWLPIAISAPTPISALVHSSTLVTAGLLIAINFRSLLAPSILFVLGAYTMVAAGISSFFEIDINKIVALSTLSQLGLIASSIGLGILTFGLFHIISHAFMNSALFLLVGVLLHQNLGSQDKRILVLSPNLGSYHFSATSLCCLSLIGLALTSGLTTNEILVISSLASQYTNSTGALLLTGVCFTLIYCYRILIACNQNTVPSSVQEGSTINELSSTCALLFLSLISAFSFQNNFLLPFGTFSSLESQLPYIILLLGPCIWNAATLNEHSLVGSSALNTFFKAFTNSPNMTSDHQYTNLINLSLLWWLDWLLLNSQNSNGNGIYLALALLFITTLLF